MAVYIKKNGKLILVGEGGGGVPFDLDLTDYVKQTEIETVAKTGEYNDLKNKPNLHQVATTGDYNDLNNLPSLFDGDYNNLINKPPVSSFSGDYNDLTNTPALFNGDYNDLINKPNIFSGDYNDLINAPAIGDYLEEPDIANLFEDVIYDSQNQELIFKRVDGIDASINLFVEALIANITLDEDNNLILTYENGDTTSTPLNTLLIGVVKTVNGKNPNSQGQVRLEFDDLDNKPNIFSGDYNDLINKPNLGSFTGDYNDLLNKPTLHTVATSGRYSDLTGRPSIFSGNYNDLANAPNIRINRTGTGTFVSNVRLDTNDPNRHTLDLQMVDVDTDGLLTQEQKDKLAIIEMDGQGEQYLSDDGTYKLLEGTGVDLERYAYMQFAAELYYKENVDEFKGAWEHSLTALHTEVEDLEDEGTTSNRKALGQYPDHLTQGIIIPYGVSQIGIYGFYNITSMKTPLIMPSTVHTIKRQAFRNWRQNNTELIIPDSVENIEAYAFAEWNANNKPITFGENIKVIEEYAFNNWSNNKHPIILPETVEEIGRYAFNGWNNVPYVVVKSEVPPVLGSWTAFNNQDDAFIYVPRDSVDDYKTATNWSRLANRIRSMQNLDSHAGSENVAIGDFAYMQQASTIYYEAQESRVFPEAWQHAAQVIIEEIEANGASGSNKGKEQYTDRSTQGIIIPYGTEVIGTHSFMNPGTGYNMPIVIPNTVEVIKIYAFHGYTDMKAQLIIPESVKEIEDQAFRNWTSNNKQIIFNEGLEKIGVRAFQGWSAYRQPLVLPSTIQEIGNIAFQDMEQVTHIEIHAEVPPTITTTTFANQNEALIFVPHESVDDYKTASTAWSAESHRIRSLRDLETIGKENPYEGENFAYAQAASQFFHEQGKLDNFRDAWDYTLTVDPNTITYNGGTSTNRGKISYEDIKDVGVIIHKDAKTIGNNSFRSFSNFNAPLFIHGGVTSVGTNAFNGVSNNLFPLVIPISVTELKGSTFRNWTNNNRQITFPRNLEQAATSEFRGWTSNDQQLIIPHEWGKVWSRMFQDWTNNNKQLIIPEGITEIGTYAFSTWTNNNKPLVLPESLERITARAFENWENNNRKITFLNTETDLTIAGSGFNGWVNNNQPLEILPNIKFTGEGHFENWLGNDKPLILHEGLEAIGTKTFYSWRNNTHPIVLPSTMTVLGADAFRYWESTPFIVSLAEVPPTLNLRVFSNTNDVNIYVPDDSVDVYKTTTRWSAAAMIDRIKPMSEMTEEEVELYEYRNKYIRD